MTSFDSDPEAKVDAALLPAARKLREPLPGCEREPDRLELVFFDGDRIVEEHHYTVAGEVLQRPVVCRDQLPEQLVVGTQHLEQLFRGSRLGERGKAPEVAEEAGDINPVAAKQLLSLFGGKERRDLR